MPIKIAVIITSIRQGRTGPEIANWTLSHALEKNEEDVIYELVDLNDYDLPFFGKANPSESNLNDVERWSKKIEKFDGYIFITAEYNHLMPGATKNAFDFLKKELENKVAGFVGYGGLGGSRSIEALRIMLSELQVATVQKSLNFLLASDFIDNHILNAKEQHIVILNEMLDQLLSWTRALKSVRE